MFPGYIYPFYQSPYTFMPSPWAVPYGYGSYGNYSTSNIINSAIANQNMNTIGFGAIGGTQIATPTVIW